MSTARGARPRRTYGRVAISRARLVDVLSRHRGEANAITADDLAVVLAVRERDNRSLREAIGEIIEDGLLAVGSTSREDRPGYFVVQTLEELEKVDRSLRRRAGEIERRRAGLRRAFHAGPLQPGLFPPRDGAEVADRAARAPEPPAASAPTASAAPAVAPGADVQIANRPRFVPPVRQFIAELERTTSATRTPEQRRRPSRGQQ